jgi:hypothetical protein
MLVKSVKELADTPLEKKKRDRANPERRRAKAKRKLRINKVERSHSRSFARRR